MCICDFLRIFARPMHRKYYILYLLLLVCAFTACTPRSIREAQSIVAQADSLWHEGKMYGVDGGDSATLAQACETLGQWQWFYADEYAHACYHYGRLLREKDNPVEAMECFINATHSRTRDYHILGRVYSNMGDLAHWGREYSLSFDVFKSAADLFLSIGDTISYYYCLNDMAFEKAMISDTATTFALLSLIKSNCIDEHVFLKTQETKAEAYMRAKEYNSALNYASVLYKQDDTSQLGLVLLSQIYSYLGIKDSAVYFAKQVLLVASDYSDIQNALYILTNDDDQKDANEIREVAADRADAQKQIEIRQGKFSQAVQLLKQDIKRPLNLSWLYAIMATLIIIGTGIGIYRKHQKRRHALLSQHIDELVTTNDAMQQQQAQIIKEQTDYIQNKIVQIEQNCLAFYNSEDFPLNLCWKDYDKMCDITNEHFYLLATKLQTIYHLSEKEIRLCVAILIGISNSEQLADMLFYCYSGIRNFKNRTAKKLGTNSVELRNILMHIAAGDHPDLQDK